MTSYRSLVIPSLDLHHARIRGQTTRHVWPGVVGYLCQDVLEHAEISEV